MVPTKVIGDAISNLLAADAATLAPVALANHVHLITSPFAPGPQTDFTVLTEATFIGSAAKSAGLGAQQSFNGADSTRVVQLLEPAGGWHWQCTVAPVAPETIVGFVVTDNADAVTYGSELFDPPIDIAGVGDGVDIPEVRLTIPVLSIV